jgi:hypothetical protein
MGAQRAALASRISSFVRKEERKRKAALMATLSTSIPIYLEMNLSVIWIEWVAPIHRGMMARSEKSAAQADPRKLRMMLAY